MGTQHIHFVDTTLRDGSHAVRHSYTVDQVSKIAAGLDRSGVSFIELSHGDGLGGSSYAYGFSAVDEFELLKAAASVMKNSTLTALLLPGIGTIENLKKAQSLGVKAVRVASHVTEADVTEQFIREAKSLGMFAVGFLMMIHMAAPERIAEEAKKNGKLRRRLY